MSYDFIWDDVIRRVRKGYFLHTSSHISDSSTFVSSDNEKLYNENLLTQPADWFYRGNPIEYKRNQYGYRTVDFDKIDWSNSIVVFGCSHVFGVGLHEEDTLSGCLSSLTNIPVINMGVISSSIEYSSYNSIILNEHYPTPKAVIQVYSSIDRTTYYYKNNVEHHAVWNMKPGNYMDLYSADATHGRVHALLSQMVNKQLWTDKTKYYETSFFSDKFNTLNLNKVLFKDVARDLKHPGRNTIRDLAIKIKEELKL